MNRNRNYPLLLASQFLGAFGDNAIRAVIVGQLTLLQRSGEIGLDELRTRSAIYTSLLFIPYVLLAPLAGYLNDRHAKTSWLLGGNLLKVLGAGVCALSLWHGYVWQAPGYLIVGIGSTIYGPAKYGILPEILPRERLVKANGMVELLTLLAILSGAIVGSVLVDRAPIWVCYAALVATFGVALALNLFMTPTPSSPDVRLGTSVREFFRHLGQMLCQPVPSWRGLGGTPQFVGDGMASALRGTRLGKILIGTALFWVCGAGMKINFQPWGLDVLRLPDNTQIALLGVWLSVGVMVGSLLAGMSFRIGDLRKVRPVGFLLGVLLVLVFAVGSLGLSGWGRQEWATVDPDGTRRVGLVFLPAVAFVLVAAGVAAGLFLIPLNAALQAESDPSKLGKTIAVQNFCDNIGMISAGLVVLGCTRVGLSASQVFLVLAVIVAAVVAWLRIPHTQESASE